ncbi:MAG: carbohydrate porin [Verrucomicrobia subdivision 3 bacterium]|nr:carbohydrate porin [Limisphaerales bacterium]
MKKIITSIVCLCGAFALPAQDSVWDREQLSGDWGGKRSAWAAAGYEFSLSYDVEVFRNASGGTSKGTVIDGLGYGALDIDLEKAAGWSSADFRISTLWTHGASATGKHVGDELTVSNMDAYDGLRLHEVWVDKSFGNHSIRFGNLLADEEFAVTEFGGVFINAAFGQPAFWAANTLNTGPAFNVAALGVRYRIDFSETCYAQAGIYDGDSFDSADGDATINQHGLHFELGNGQGWTSLYEIGYNGFAVDDGTGLPSAYRLGAWHHSTSFSKHDSTNGEGNWGLYGATDKLLWREEGDQGLGSFLRFGTGQRDRSRFHWVFDTGLSYTGLLPGRDEDVAGLGFVYAKHSGAITDAVKSHEAVIEATYRIQLAPAVYLQPDIQWINRPSGDTTTSDALVFGLRAGFTF